MDFSNIIGFNAWNVTSRTNFRILWHNKVQEGEGYSILMLMKKGRCFIDLGDGEFTISSGQMVCYENSQLKRHRPDPFNPPSYTLLMGEYFSRFGQVVKLSDVGIPKLFKPHGSTEILSYFHRIQKQLKSNSPNRLPQASILGLQLLDLLSKCIPPVKSPMIVAAPYSVHKNILPILDLLRSDFKKNFTIHELAKRAEMNTETFRRLFKETTGLLPKQYALERKIEQAKQYMLSDFMALQDIAEELGFCDYSNFHRAFRKIEGVAPAEFVKRHTAEN